jgi:hypothetical protein
MIIRTKLFFYNFLKFWDLPLANGPWRLKILKKNIHGRVKILGWSKKRHGTFSESRSVAESKNVYILYVWRSSLTARSKKDKNLWNFLEIISSGWNWPPNIQKNAHFSNQRAKCHVDFWTNLKFWLYNDFFLQNFQFSRPMCERKISKF